MAGRHCLGSTNLSADIVAKGHNYAIKGTAAWTWHSSYHVPPMPILLDTWGARTVASPKLAWEEADRLLREVERLGNPPALRARALASSGSSWRSLAEGLNLAKNLAIRFRPQWFGNRVRIE